MQKSSALPTGALFEVDDLACLRAAQLIRRYRASPELSHSGRHSTEERLAFKIAFVSVCHQYNWEILQSTLATKLLGGGTDDFVARLQRVSADDIQQWLSSYPQPERIRASERSEILRTVARTFRDKFGGNPMNLVNESNRRVAGPTGFVSQMDAFDAFRIDPLRKKTNVLMHELVRERIVRFVDEENIGPAVDYHLIRIYTRTGRVYPLHASTFSTLTSLAPRPRDRLVRLLREKVAEAVALTSRFSGLTVPEVNYIEWQLGRNVCIRGVPRCVSRDVMPRFDPDVEALLTNRCPFSTACLAYSDRHWMELHEPVFAKTFY